MKSSTYAALVVCGWLLFVSPAVAQEVQDPFDTARFRWGPFAFTPTLEVGNVGVDTNVFNEVENPRSDFTAAFGPGVKLWMRPAGSRLSLVTRGQYLYFREYASQRAWNTTHEAKWEVPLARLTPFVAGTYSNTRERQGYEIDARSRRRDWSYTAGSALRLSGKTSLVGSFRHATLRYDEDETFVGATLADALNRTEETSTVQFRYTLTPLTTFVTDMSVRQDRFEFSPVRDSNSVRVMPGFELKPFALISGTAFVGYRQFKPLDDIIPEYQGVVAAVRAEYNHSATRYEVHVDRDVTYSYEAVQPYYVLMDYGLTVTQRVTGRWDLVGRGSLQRLGYQRMANQLTPISVRDRVDRGTTFGGGIGYRRNEVTRIGLDVIHTRRTSDVAFRSFEGTRIFGSITYGTAQ